MDYDPLRENLEHEIAKLIERCDPVELRDLNKVSFMLSDWIVLVVLPRQNTIGFITAEWDGETWRSRNLTRTVLYREYGVLKSYIPRPHETEYVQADDEKLTQMLLTLMAANQKGALPRHWNPEDNEPPA